MSLFAIRDDTLSVAEVVQAVEHPSAGGISVFVGAVRDENAGQQITLLEYEAYVSMAEKEMAAIGAELEAELPGVRVAATHRIGRLEIGDAAVICAASAKHRGDAFTACRALIDRIKERVPIWKREHGPAGPYWVNWEDARTGSKEHR